MILGYNFHYAALYKDAQFRKLQKILVRMSNAAYELYSRNHQLFIASYIHLVHIFFMALWISMGTLVCLNYYCSKNGINSMLSLSRTQNNGNLSGWGFSIHGTASCRNFKFIVNEQHKTIYF